MYPVVIVFVAAVIIVIPLKSAIDVSVNCSRLDILRMSIIIGSVTNIVPPGIPGDANPITAIRTANIMYCSNVMGMFKY